MGRINNLNVDARGRHIVTPSQALAAEIAEFGGAFIDDHGTLNVYLTHERGRAAASTALNKQFKLFKRRPLPIHFINAQHSFRELENYEDAVKPYYNEASIVYLWVDEWKNRLRVGVDDKTLAEHVLRPVLARLGIPQSAVTIESTKRPVPATTHYLTDPVRPLVGGLMITDEASHPSTLTALVTLDGETLALVSSHAVDINGNGVTGQTVKQGLPIGTVSVNPAFTAMQYCPVAKCRYSDAALVALSATTNFAHLARPSTGIHYNGDPNVNATFDDTNLIELTEDGVWCIESYTCGIEFYPGDSASKIGQLTGWTGGKYLGLSSGVTGADGLHRFETIIVEGASEQGDSGGPILSKETNRIAGILWGGGIQIDGKPAFLGSTWPNISAELSGSPYRLHPATAKMLGWRAEWIHPPNCYDNPDAYSVYLIYGYPLGDGTYETASRYYMGDNWYYCNGYVNGYWQQSAEYQMCVEAFGGNCPCADHTVGNTNCDIREP